MRRNAYKSVYDLDEAELAELKEAYYIMLMESDDDVEYMYPDEIPDVVVMEYYDGIQFTKDDFFCNITDGNYEGCGAAYAGI